MDEYSGTSFWEFAQKNADQWLPQTVGAVKDYLVTNPYNIEKMKLQMLGDAGYAIEGERGVVPSRSVAGVTGISPMVMILGAGLLFFALKD